MKRRSLFIPVLCATLALSSCQFLPTPADTAATTVSVPDITTTTVSETTAETTTTTTAATETSEAATSASTTSDDDDDWDDDNVDVLSIPRYDSDPVSHPIRLGVWLERNEDSYNGVYYKYVIIDEGGLCYVYFQDGDYAGDSFYDIMRYVMNEDDPSHGSCCLAGVIWHDMEILEANDDTVKFKVDYQDGPVTLTYLCDKDEFSFYNNKQLIQLAEHYLLSKDHYEYQPAESEATTIDDVRVCINMRVDDPDGNILGGAIYYINRYNLLGYDADDNGVNLRDFTEGWDDMPAPISFDTDEYLESKVTEELSSEGALFGVWYLGQTDGFYEPGYNMPSDYILNMFGATGALLKIGGLKDLSEKPVIGRGDHYCLVIPADKNGTLTVESAEKTTGAFGLAADHKKLYITEYENRPILLRFDMTGTYPAETIKISDSEGRYAEWTPTLGESGKLVTDSGSGTVIHDFTDYSNTGFGLG